MSEDEARDTLGELKRFAPPPAMDQPISVMFFVDLSLSMQRADITGREGLRRIDAVIEVLKRFVTQQMAAGAVMDVYSLVTFSISTYQVRFHRQRGAEAVSKLTSETFEPGGAVTYSEIIRAMGALAVPGQACRVIFLSDGCTGSLKNHVLPTFQQAIMDNPHIILHCIGFGGSDFAILQQLAQIGRGSFSRASMDIDNLVNTFTSLSKTVTQTRNSSHIQERVARTVTFDSATRFGDCKRGVDFKIDGARTGHRRTYKLDPSVGLNRTSNKKCVLRLHKNPFMQGGMRLVYRCQDADIPTEMVAKFSRFEEDDNSWGFIAMFIKNTAQTRELTQQFHDAYWWARYDCGYALEPLRLVSCTQAWVYDLPKTLVDPKLIFVAEAFLHGSEKGFLKWVNNRGEILIPSSSSDFSMAAEAFAHFSLDASGGKLMVSDLQGVLKKGDGNCRRIHLTDPQILSWDQSFGAADLGPTAMQTFRSLHVCNALCKKLRLSSLSCVPRAPRTRSALCNVRQRPTLPVMPPPSEPLQRERGRSPTRRHVESTEPRSDDMETLKATNLLLSDDGSKAKRLLFVGEYTHLFTVAAAKFVKLRLQLPSLKLEWHSTELCWPRLESMRAELQQSLDYLTPLGVTAHDKVDATALDLWRLRSLAGAIWVWTPSCLHVLKYPSLTMVQCSADFF